MLEFIAMVAPGNKKLLLWIFFILVMAVTSVSPQDTALLKLESDLVSIDVTVMDQQGNYVTNLGESDFTILHDGVPIPISFFDAVENRSLSRPLAVVFALDVSGSLGSQVSDQQYAARRFVSLVREPSLFAVIGFNDRVHVYQNFTSEPRKLEEAFRKAKKIGGRTRLYDAIDQSITMLVRQSPAKRNERPLRRVVVVITDGFDYTSLIDRRDLIRRANNAGVTVYSVTLPSYIMSVRGRQRVPTLLDAAGIVSGTGGIDFPAEERNFSRIFREIAEEIRASYMLAYYPPKTELTDGRTHKIKVTIDQPGFTVRQNRYEYTAVKR